MSELGEASFNHISEIYVKAVSSIDEPKNLQKIISEINKLDWYEAKQEGLGDLYEGLLAKNADEKKSGAGQYFTPRVLIDVMVELIDPKFEDSCFDPACGTFGFMIAAYKHATKDKDIYSLSDHEVHAIQEHYGGVELVPDAHRLALMNAYLHNVPEISRVWTRFPLTQRNSKALMSFSLTHLSVQRKVESVRPVMIFLSRLQTSS